MFGIDISNCNGNIDFNVLKNNNNIDIIIIKATEGVDFKDNMCNTYYNNAKTVGFNNIGFYHFMSEKTNPARQAEDFWNMIKDKEYNIKPCLDIEVNNYGRSAAEITNRCLTFINKFKELSGQEIMIYTGGYFGRDNLDSRIKNYVGWIAHYGVNTPMETGFTVGGHQYTETGHVAGINGNVDLNNFNDNIFLDSCNYTTTNNNTNNNNNNEKVLELQKLANAIIGAGLAEDGIWGNCTDNAVHNLPLCGLPYVQRDLTRWVQLRLGTTPDGIFGNQTAESVKYWQRTHNLNVDGIVGYNTYKSLALA